MTLSLQKAGLWKRISAFLFDIILTVTLAVGLSVVASAIFGYNGQAAKLEARYTYFETEYGVQFDLSEEEQEKLTEEQKLRLEEASEAFMKDAEVLQIYNTLFYMTLAIISVSAFVAILIWQFFIPLIFGYGQTLGKKIFGIAVIRTNFTKAANPVLFIRAMIGMFAIETMFPLLMFIMMAFGLLGTVGLITLLLFVGLEVFVMIKTNTNSTIHDLLCDTVVIDFASQMIFDTDEDRERYLRESEQSSTVLDSSN